MESAGSQNMTRGAATCWQQDDHRGGDDDDDDDNDDDDLGTGPDPPKPFTDTERPQRWRSSWASLLFLSALLSDQLRFFSAEATLPARTRDKFSPVRRLLLSPQTSTERPFLPGNRSEPRRPDTCQRDRGLSSADAERLCSGLSSASVNMSDLFLSFCSSYSLLDLLSGSASPDSLNCSLDVLPAGGPGGGPGAPGRASTGAGSGDTSRCSQCVQAYQRYDQHAQEKYEDFEMLARKYEPAAFSVRTCMERCKTAYKPWLCAQYFPSAAQRSCSRKVPCRQFCLEVQQSCPFILPDNDDLIHGGSPSFICTGLEPSDGAETECCDVRWDSWFDGRPGGALRRTASSCRLGSGSAPSSAASPRLKICLLALVLLHTAIVISTCHNTTALDDPASNED